MSRVIAVANQKGGVAKTTTTANLGAALSQAGYRVLLLDMDPQGSLTVWSGRNPDTLDLTMYDALIKGRDSREILLPTALGPDLLPANIDLSMAEMELLGAVARERRLAMVLAPVRDEYDFILMDCQPSLGLLTVNAFTAADEVLVPVVCEFLSTRAVDVLLRMMAKVRLEQNSRLKLTGFVPTMYDARLRHARAELEELQGRYANMAPVLTGCIVPRSVRFAEAAAAGRSILHYLPNHPGSEAYRRLARFLNGDVEAGFAFDEDAPSGVEPGWVPFAHEESAPAPGPARPELDRFVEPLGAPRPSPIPAEAAGRGIAIETEARGIAPETEEGAVAHQTEDRDAASGAEPSPTARETEGWKPAPAVEGRDDLTAAPRPRLGAALPEPRIDVFVRKDDERRRRRR